MLLFFQGKNLFLLDVKNDEAFPPSDRFLLIPSLSGGGWAVIFPSCSVKLPLSSCTHSVVPFLQAHTNFLFTNAFFFFFIPPPRAQRPATGRSVGSRGGECNYEEEDRVETLWKAH